MTVCEKEIVLDGFIPRIARLDADTFQFVEDPEPLVRGLQESDARIDLFTFLQRLPDQRPRFSYPMEMDNLAVLPVSTYDYWWTKQIRSYPRNRARQAEKKGVTLREVPFDDALVNGIWSVYNECPVRQGRSFRHYGKDLETVRSEASTYLDSSVFVGAFLESELIGFVKLVMDETRTQAKLMNIISMVRHWDKAPTNALIAQSVRACANRGIRYLVYGNFVYGNKRSDGITDFKINNGFNHVDVPRYYVPLTAIGRAALSLGLHHRLVDHFPEPISRCLRRIRAFWQSQKLQAALESRELK